MRRLLGIAVAALELVAGSAAGETVKLVNGDTLEGKVLERTDDGIVLEHPVLGRLELDADQLAAEETQPGLFGSTFLKGWHRQLEAGFNGAQGNSETLNARLGLHLGVRDDHRRWDIDAVYHLARSDGETSDNTAYAQAVFDFLHPDRRWFPFADARWEFDEFNDWDHRISAHAGVGHQLFENERFELHGRVGAGATRPFGSDDDSFAPEALIGLGATWTLSDRMELDFYSKFFADLEDFGEYRNLSGAAWIVDILDEAGLRLKLGVDNRYESWVSEDTKRNDLKYYGSVLLDF